MLSEFESSSHWRDLRITKHREHVPYVQEKFAENVKNPLDTFEEIGNPFENDSGYLMKLNFKEVANERVLEYDRNVVALGTEQYNRFITDRFHGDKPMISRTHPSPSDSAGLLCG